jgi:hypothetical protein
VDLGYKQNKCRLCGRRMKNKIAPEALEGLKSLNTSGTMVQLVSIAQSSCTRAQCTNP